MSLDHVLQLRDALSGVLDEGAARPPALPIAEIAWKLVREGLADEPRSRASTSRRCVHGYKWLCSAEVGLSEVLDEAKRRSLRSRLC